MTLDHDSDYGRLILFLVSKTKKLLSLHESAIATSELPLVSIVVHTVILLTGATRAAPSAMGIDSHDDVRIEDRSNLVINDGS